MAIDVIVNCCATNEVVAGVSNLPELLLGVMSLQPSLNSVWTPPVGRRGELVRRQIPPEI